MITKEKILNCKRLITHADCADGIASAMIFTYFLPKIEVVFCQHNSKQHQELTPQDGDIFCDFVPHRNNIQAFVDAGAIVLDHHKSAKDIVEQFGENGKFADEILDPGVSGAVLAHEVFRDICNLANTKIIYDFARLVGIRDTFQRKSSEWKEACAISAALKFYGPDYFLSMDRCYLKKDEKKIGVLLYEQQLSEAQKAIKSSWREGKYVLFNDSTNKLISDVADLLRELSSDAEAVASFNYSSENNIPILNWSFRSINPNFDVSKLALENGGGGHTKAAGVKIRDSRIVKLHPNEMFHAMLIRAGYNLE